MYKRQWIILLLLPVVLGCASCQWHEAKEVIAMADSIDQTQHVIYDDTAALGGVIRTLDNPLGKLLMSNTLGKAYYYMGRNLSFSNQIAEAADCYIEADRLQIDNPIYRGRVNACAGYICAMNSADSLALIFYKRASKAFEEGDDKWRYAQSLLNISYHLINRHMFMMADSLLNIARSYQLNDTYYARYCETRGVYFYEQQQYELALTCLKQHLNSWETEEEKGYSYLKIMQAYYFGNISMDSAVLYAHKLIHTSNNPNYISNAYYCLAQDAKKNNNIELLSQYSCARTDAQRILRDGMVKHAEALPLLKEYLANPYPMRWIRIILFSFVTLCLILVVSIFVYSKHTVNRMQVSEEQLVSLSTKVHEQQNKLQEQNKLHYNEKLLDKVRRKYPKPPHRWNKYAELKKDVQPYLHNWFMALEELDLTNREKVFCAISFVYPQMATEDLANYLCITVEAVAVRKTRIAKKIGITSTQLADFLRNILNHD